MGIVWLAEDLKLRVEVALKAVRPEHSASEERREGLRREVRAAREVVSPNVCRVFDLVAEDGHELVSMEYVVGETLAELLEVRGPLEVLEARDLASQFLAGLESIHRAGLVHRDFKPENVMVTASGRVVVMDLGIARRPDSESGSVVGTPAYMSPEQLRGSEVDARSDVYAAGVVLAEMTAPAGVRGKESRRRLHESLREEPPLVPDGPWSEVIRRALSREASERYASAQELSRALERVTQRLGAVEASPYPGLSAFTERDSEHFFGREAEVEALLRKLGPSRLVGLVGPSGAGKSSFVRAGVIPALQEGWGWLVFHPGERPFAALADVLVPELSGDAEATRELLRIEESDSALSALRRWRRKYAHVLLVADQFEELFTLSGEEVQGRFAALLGRLPLEADVHVLISMRDDFLLACHRHPGLRPLESELTLLTAPEGPALRRALVEPGLRQGYRFEDENLSEEILRRVESERGALPLLAFVASRMWEERDRERGLLTREAYERLGGVEGALAQHAEAALGRIGPSREALVRELFRNLVTAQGTRASRERQELLSVFEDRAAGEVLSGLIDARLLTSYELPAGDGGEPRRRIEIVHESLLSAWPRLVRWQTQDADGAQLRDQLRQASRLWEERGRPEDLLWTGTSYREYALWRERYPGGLTSVEEAYGRAMTAHALRRRRRGRLVAGAFAAGLTVALATVVTLWRGSERARAEATASEARAVAEARRSEASKLMVLGESDLATYPTGALAYAIASLETADTEAGRLLALRVLQRAPVARIAPVGNGAASGGWALGLDFSPDGEWVATGGYTKSEVLNRDGDRRLLLGEYTSLGQNFMGLGFTPDSRALVTNLNGEVRLWSIPEGRELSRLQLDPGVAQVIRSGDSLFTLTNLGDRDVLRRWPSGVGEPRLVGTLEHVGSTFSTASGLFAFGRGHGVFLRPLENWSVPPRLVGEHTSRVWDLGLSPDARRLASRDESGEIRLWETRGRSSAPLRVMKAPGALGVLFDPNERWLLALGRVEGTPAMRVWETQGLAGAEPLMLLRNDTHFMLQARFDSRSQWLASAHVNDVAFWWLGGSRCQVARVGETVGGLAFTADGDDLVSASLDGLVRLWPLHVPSETEVRVLFRTPPFGGKGLVLDPTGRTAAVGGVRGQLYLVPLDGRPGRPLLGFSERTDIAKGLAFSTDGRLLAAAPYIGPPNEKLTRIWDLETGETRVLGPIPGAGENVIGGVGNASGPPIFVDQNRRLLLTAHGVGLVRVDLVDGTVTVLSPHPKIGGFFDHAGTSGVGFTTSSVEVSDARHAEPVRFRLDGSEPEPLAWLGKGDQLSAAAFDASDRVLATGGPDGTVRVQLADGGEPHLLFGHDGRVMALAFSPDGQWLASGGGDGRIRVCPVPDVTATPFHRLPLEDLLAKLRTHTNLRAVSDPSAPTGYRLEPGSFPGWAHPPESWYTPAPASTERASPQ